MTRSAVALCVSEFPFGVLQMMHTEPNPFCDRSGPVQVRANRARIVPANDSAESGLLTMSIATSRRRCYLNPLLL